MNNNIGIYNVRTADETLQMLQDIHAIALFFESVQTIEDMLATGLEQTTGRAERPSMTFQYGKVISIEYKKPLSSDNLCCCTLSDTDRDAVNKGKSIVFYNSTKLAKKTMTQVSSSGQRGLISGYHFSAAQAGIGFSNMTRDAYDTHGFQSTDWIDLTNPEESYFMNSTVQSADLQYISFLDFYLRFVNCPSIFVTYDIVQNVIAVIPNKFQIKARNSMNNFHTQQAEMLIKFHELLGE